MKIITWKNIVFLVVILIMILPQTRQPLQILVHKGLALFSPSVLDEDNRVSVSNYDWQLLDEDGQAYDFNDSRGKVVMINFWATWCPPCIAEMPSMDKLYQEYKDDVVFLFISEENNQTISKFKNKHGYEFPVHSSLTASPVVFKTRSIPRTFILDKNGTIVMDTSGAADWNSKSVRNLLDTLLKSK